MEKEMFEKGLKIRREVLGAEYVDKAISTADDFNRPLQELVTTYCWGEIWGRPGLDRKTRSMLNLAMISALNRPHEIKAHVKGAINNGLTKNDIQEVFLQVAIYVGVPATEEHLRSKYLVFETNCDVDIEEYMTGLAMHVPDQIEAVWSHCVGYPGIVDVPAFVKYMKACQVPTTFFFAATNDKSVTETLLALQNKRAVAEFITTHQGMGPMQIQQEFAAFMRELRDAPKPVPGRMRLSRVGETGGHNE